MSDTQWWRRLWLGRMLSLVLLILAGCGGSDGTGGSPTVAGMSQLLLHVTTPDQAKAGLTPRAVAPGQTRQAEPITLLRVVVSGPGIPTPIVAECPIPGPLTQQCQVTETPEAFIVAIALLVPVGTERLVVVTGLDQTGADILRGMGTVDLTQPLQTLTVMLAPVQANTPPRADAGPDQTVAVGTTVMLLGNGSSDTDGDPLTFAWVLLVRPPGSQATLSNPTSVNPTFVVDRPGGYMVQLTVNDGEVDSQPDVVTISTVSLPPVANAGPNQLLGAAGQLVQLDGSGSSDADGDPLTFRWALTTRPAGSQATLTNATLVNPSFVADILGTYVAQLIVNDGTFESLPATVTITPGPLPPVANAGPNQLLGAAGQLVQLDGSGSSDADGDPLTFRWALTTRPAGSQATLTNATLVNPTFVADVLGTYVAQLIVNDGTFDSLPATVTITPDRLPPVANAGPNQLLVAAGQLVQLDGSGSSDANGDPLTFRWALTTRPSDSQATLTNATLVNPSFVADVLGTYVAQLIVNDGTLDSLPATVTITPDRLPPVANAGPNQQLVAAGKLVQLDGSGSSDANGDPLTFLWTFVTRPPQSNATLTNATLVNPTFVADILDTYVVQLIVNDGTLESLPATVTITPDRIPPVADAGPDQSLQVRQLVQLDGSASSDANGDPLTFQWALTRPPRSNATLANATTAQPTFRADIPGTYTVQLIVNDGIAGSAPDTVTITANVPQPRFAYVANASDFPGSISSFAIDPSMGVLTPVPMGGNFLLTDTSSVSGATSTPQEVSVHPSGRFAYAAAGTDFDLSGRVFLVYGITTDTETGVLTSMSGSPFRVGGFADAVAVDPSGRFAYVVTNDDGESSGSTGVTGFTIDPGTGMLTTPLTSPPFPPGSLPRAIVIDPTARFAYVVNGSLNSVSGFTINAGTGVLTELPNSPFPTGSPGSSPQAIAIDPTAQFAYVVVTDSTETGFEGVLGFRIDAVTGALARLPIPNSSFSAGAAPVSVTTEPSGQFLYVANSGDDTVSGYTIEATTGALMPLLPIDTFPAGQAPQAVVVDPSGRFAYVACFGNDNAGAITTYTIVPGTGALVDASTFVDVSINGPVSIAISGF